MLDAEEFMTRADQSIEIAGRKIGEGHPAYLIAELSANHRQSYDHAVALVRAAEAAGADAIKLQTYTADTLTLASDRPCFRVGGGTLWDGRTLHDLYLEASMPWEWQPRLKEVAEDLGLTLFSTPFDESAVAFLEDMNVPAFKIASPELVDLPLIARVAGTGRPLIMSTGMASLAEIDEAVRTARAAGATQIALLKCTSAYPCPPGEMNLRTIPFLYEAFNVPVGLSDHTRGISAAVAAVALGASIIEKHFTLSRNDGGPDAAFSLEPEEFSQMVAAVREAEESLGRASFDVGPHEARNLPYRRSLFVVRDMQAGERFTVGNVRSIRPAAGLPPRHLPELLGRRAARDLLAGTPLEWSCVAPPEIAACQEPVETAKSC